MSCLLTYWGHYVWQLTSSIHVKHLDDFFTFQRVLFWRHLLTVTSSKSSPPGESQQSGFRFRRLLWEFQHKILSRTRLVDRLLNKIDSSTAAVYRNTGRWRAYTVFLNGMKHCACWTLDVQRGVVGKSRKRQASVNGDVVSNVFCNRPADTSNMSLNETTMFVQSIFHNVWTEVRNQEGLRKQIFVFIKGKRVVVFHHFV